MPTPHIKSNRMNKRMKTDIQALKGESSLYYSIILPCSNVQTSSRLRREVLFVAGLGHPSHQLTTPTPSAPQWEPRPGRRAFRPGRVPTGSSSWRALRTDSHSQLLTVLSASSTPSCFPRSTLCSKSFSCPGETTSKFLSTKTLIGF